MLVTLVQIINQTYSDTFNFELIKQGKAIFVDVGISTYEKTQDKRKDQHIHIIQ